jgi:hypothetical protein
MKISKTVANDAQNFNKTTSFIDCMTDPLYDLNKVSASREFDDLRHAESER